MDAAPGARNKHHVMHAGRVVGQVRADLHDDITITTTAMSPTRTPRQNASMHNPYRRAARAPPVRGVRLAGPVGYEIDRCDAHLLGAAASGSRHVLTSGNPDRKSLTWETGSADRSLGTSPRARRPRSVPDCAPGPEHA